MLQNYFKLAIHKQLQPRPGTSLGRLAAIVAGMLVCCYTFTSGEVRLPRVPPPFFQLMVQSSTSAQEMSQALLTILMFEDADRQIAFRK